MTPWRRPRRRGPLLRVRSEEPVVLALQHLGAELEVDGELGQVRHLGALLGEPFVPDEDAVDERHVDEVPRVRVLGVDAADAALELPALELESLRKRRRDEEGLLDLHAFLLDRQDRVEVEVRVHGREHDQFGRVEVEALPALEAGEGVVRDAAAFEPVLVDVRGLGVRVEDEREVRVGQGRAAEETGSRG